MFWKEEFLCFASLSLSLSLGTLKWKHKFIWSNLFPVFVVVSGLEKKRHIAWSTLSGTQLFDGCGFEYTNLIDQLYYEPLLLLMLLLMLLLLLLLLLLSSLVSKEKAKIILDKLIRNVWMVWVRVYMTLLEQIEKIYFLIKIFFSNNW